MFLIQFLSGLRLDAEKNPIARIKYTKIFKLSLGSTKLIDNMIKPVINWDKNNHDFLRNLVFFPNFGRQISHLITHYRAAHGGKRDQIDDTAISNILIDGRGFYHYKFSRKCTDGPQFEPTDIHLNRLFRREVVLSREREFTYLWAVCRQTEELGLRNP